MLQAVSYAAAARFCTSLALVVRSRAIANTGPSDDGTSTAAAVVDDETCSTRPGVFHMTRSAPDRCLSADVFAEAMTTRLKLAADGKLLELAQFHERSGLSRRAIHQQINSGSLFTVDGPEGVNYYPAFFADTKYDRAVVRRVARALKGLAGGSKWIFFTSPRHG